MSELTCLCADARDASAYRRALGEARADALVTDPPYCLLTRRRKQGDLRYSKGRKIDRDPVLRFESVRDYRKFTTDWMTPATEALKAEAPLLIWTNFLGKAPILEVAAQLGYRHQWGEFVWAKRTTEAQGNELLLRVYETALVLSRAPCPVPGLSDKSLAWAVVAGYDDEGEAAQWGSHRHHKPFGVLEPLLRNFVAPGGLVLEPFAGSGSIPAAALRLQRRVACLELVPEWAERVTARLAGWR